MGLWPRKRKENKMAANPVQIARDAHDVVRGIKAKSPDQLRTLYYKNADARVQFARGLVSRNSEKLGGIALAQLYALDVLGSINAEYMNKDYMNSFTEKLRQELVDRISTFGEKSYPLTDAQFDAAVKAAW
jgi:hypothetical protein